MTVTAHKIAGYGWHPDLPDPRDRIYGATEPIFTASQVAPSGGIVPDELPPIWDQQTIGSCTAHGSLRGWVAEAMRQGISLPTPPPGGAPLSRLMQYFDTRAVEGTTASDAGGQVRDAIKVLATDGCAPETEWPYDTAQFAIAPPAVCYEAAKQYMSISYQRVVVGIPGAPMRTALAMGKVIVFGFPVPDYFEDGSWNPASGEPLPLPGPNTNFIGGHCVALTAYDFRRWLFPVPFFRADNSWGAGWGIAGRFNMDSEWFNPSRGLASDLWVISSVA